jgi:MSHA biogenesis protein MshQ
LEYWNCSISLLAVYSSGVQCADGLNWDKAEKQEEIRVMALLSKRPLSVLYHYCLLSLIFLALINMMGCRGGDLFGGERNKDSNVEDNNDGNREGGDDDLLHQGPWYDSDWQFRQRIEISPNVTDVNHANFPYLVMIANPTNPLFSAAQANGGDILFTDSGGLSKLDHEIETYDGGNHVLYAWVRVPFLSSTNITVVYMYYGNASAANQQNPTDVWDNHYQGVWHLKETPTIDNFAYDSTANTNDGHFEGGMDEFAQIPGKIGGSLEFDGSDDLIRVPDDATLDTTQDEGTFELWINWADSADGNVQIVMTSSNRFEPSNQDGYEWASEGNGDHFFYPWVGDNDNYNLGPNPFSNGLWHHLAVTLNRATREVIIYVDGVPMTFTEEEVPGEWDQPASPDDWLWGGNPDRSARYFLGKFDEIRVSDQVRSPEWIEACARNQGSPGTFQSLGIEEDY